MNRMKINILFFGFILILGCSKENSSDMLDFYKMYGSENEDPASQLQRLSDRTVYFGHQSVGFNILQGIEAWSAETGVPIDIVDTRNFSEADHPALIHFGIGQNEDPNSKTDDFVSVLSEMGEDTGAIALFKFCYVDFHDESDVDPIFDYFKEKMLHLKEEYPGVIIVLCTVPYTALQKGIKAVAKKVLSMPLAGELENIKRSEFNERLISELGPEFPVFDLGKIEATKPDGTLNTYKYEGETYPAMVHQYTDDLDHPNTLGSRIIAYNMISFLADLPEN